LNRAAFGAVAVAGVAGMSGAVPSVVALLALAIVAVLMAGAYAAALLMRRRGAPADVRRRVEECTRAIARLSLASQAAADRLRRGAHSMRRPAADELDAALRGALTAWNGLIASLGNTTVATSAPAEGGPDH
jgi:hypothetical protein